MLKTKIFITTTMNALASTQKKKKILANLILKKNILFLFLLVDDCILMYLEITILCIYNFLIPYGYLFVCFFSLYSSSRYLKILGPSLVYVLAVHGNFVCYSISLCLYLECLYVSSLLWHLLEKVYVPLDITFQSNFAGLQFTMNLFKRSSTCYA